ASTSGTPCTPAACGCCSPSWSAWPDRKSTRLNSSHRCISYAVFCLKKKKTRSAPKRGRRARGQEGTGRGAHDAAHKRGGDDGVAQGSPKGQHAHQAHARQGKDNRQEQRVPDGPPPAPDEV